MRVSIVREVTHKKEEEKKVSIFLYLVSKIAINIEGWLKTCPSYLVYNQIWLNLAKFLRDNHHIFSIFQWLIARFLKHLPMDGWHVFCHHFFQHLSYGWMNLSLFLHPFPMDVWLSLFLHPFPMDDHHFFCIFQWTITTFPSIFAYGWLPHTRQRKNQNKLVWPNKMVLAQNFCTVCLLRLVHKRHTKP